MARLAALLLVACTVLSAQVPRFEDYPAVERFTGTPAAPKLVESWARRFQTRIREGAVGKYPAWRGFEEFKVEGPNYAGHYYVANWGCGTGCLMLVVIDAVTGTVYPPPLSAGTTGSNRMILPGLGTGWADFDFQPESRLFVLKTCPLVDGRRYPFSGTSYFAIEADGWKLVHRVACENPSSH
jgi:hypothetical protein